MKSFGEAAINGPVQGRIGRYVLGQAFARGGMATVHLGHWTDASGTERRVAIKRLHPHLACIPDFVDMFLDEARTSRRLEHPNIVTTVEVALGAEGEVFLIMEYVDGDSLANLLRAMPEPRRCFPSRIASTIMTGTLLGLEAAHTASDETGRRLQVVHRDISPQNILLGDDGVPRIIDFGIARAVGRLHQTRDGTVKGKMSYMAPELFRGSQASPSSDVYAASVVLWELLGGVKLFDGANDGAIMSSILDGTIPKPSVHSRSCTPELDAVVLKGLARTPEARWPSAKAMARALADALAPASPVTVVDWLDANLGGHRAERHRAMIGMHTPLETSVDVRVPDRTAASIRIKGRAREKVKSAPSDLTFTGATLELPPAQAPAPAAVGGSEATVVQRAPSQSWPQMAPVARVDTSRVPFVEGGRGRTVRLARPSEPELQNAQLASALWVGDASIARSSSPDLTPEPHVYLPSRRGWAVFGLLLGAVALAALLWGAFRRVDLNDSGPIAGASKSTLPEAPPTWSDADTDPRLAIAEPAADASTGAAPPPESAPSARTETSQTASAPVLSATPPMARPKSRPTPAIAPSKPRPPSGPDCSVPYVQDSRGRKVFKRECL